MSTMVARPPQFSGCYGYGYSHHDRRYTYAEKGKGKAPTMGYVGWQYDGERKERKRGRSQQVSRAAMARKASEERRRMGPETAVAEKRKGKEREGYSEVEGEGVYVRGRGNFATGGAMSLSVTSGYRHSRDRGQRPESLSIRGHDLTSAPSSDPHHGEQESALDRLHLAYASDDLQLARRLVLELDGIVVDSEDDPRIALVKDEDFDRHFLPNGGPKLDDFHRQGEPRLSYSAKHARGFNSALLSDVWPQSAASSHSIHESESSCRFTDKAPQLLYSYMDMRTAHPTPRLHRPSSALPALPPPTRTMTSHATSSKAKVSFEDVQRSRGGALFPPDHSPLPTLPSPSSSSSSSSSASSITHRKRKTQVALLSTLLDSHPNVSNQPTRTWARSCDVCRSRKASCQAISSAAPSVRLQHPTTTTEPPVSAKHRSGLWFSFRNYATSTTSPSATRGDEAHSSSSPTLHTPSTSSTSSAASSETSNSSSLITTPATSPCTSPPSMSPSNPPAFLPSLESDDSFDQSSPPLGSKTRTFAGFSLISWLRPHLSPSTAMSPPPQAAPLTDQMEDNAKSLVAAPPKCSCPRELEKLVVRRGECPLSASRLGEDGYIMSFADDDSMTSPTTSLSPRSSSPLSSPPPYTLSLSSISTHIAQLGKVLQSFSQLNTAYASAVVGMSDDTDIDINQCGYDPEKSSTRPYSRNGRRGAGMSPPPSFMGGGMMGRMSMTGTGYAGYGFAGVPGIQPLGSGDKGGRNKGMMNLGVREEHIYRRVLTSYPPPPPVRGRVRVRKKRSGYRASREDILRVFELAAPARTTVAIPPSPPSSPTAASHASPSEYMPNDLDDDGVMDIDAVDIPLIPIARGRSGAAGRGRMGLSQLHKASNAARAQGDGPISAGGERGRAWQRRGHSGYSPYAHSPEYVLSLGPSSPPQSLPPSPSPSQQQHMYLRPVANPVYLRLKAVKNVVGLRRGKGVGAGITTEGSGMPALASETSDSGESESIVETMDPTTITEPPNAAPPTSSPSSQAHTKEPAAIDSCSYTEEAAIDIVIRVRSGAMGSGKERMCGVGGGVRGRSLLGFVNVVAA